MTWTFGRRDIGDYMHRWILETPWFSIRLHHILRSDDDRALHDHPWDFVSIILRGGYDEVTPCDGLCDPIVRCARHRREFGPAQLNRKYAEARHRIELPEGRTAWTLCLTGRRRRTWGFLTPHGWVPWHEYAGAEP